MAPYDYTTCGTCGDKIPYEAEHDCWVRRKIETQDIFPAPESYTLPADPLHAE